MAHNPPPLPLPSAFVAAAAALTSTCSYLGYRHHNRSRHVDLPVHKAAPSATAVDWRAKGCVNTIKDQVRRACCACQRR